MAIRILDPEVIGKIAAGEVVERPASVVKELVENALDADAGAVHIEVLAGGCDLIRVADDGAGITREDLLVATQRHATSKIRAVEDLDSVSTLGFRGEALASIAAVSELSICSRPPDSPSAYLLRVSGGVAEGIAAAARAPGTTVTVERLFFNVPARRKFLHSPGSESTQVARLVSQLALAYPEVAFTLTTDDRRTLSTSGSGNPLDAALAVLGPEVAAALLPLETTLEFDRPVRGTAARITGLASSSRISRATRTGIWLFVNRRPVQSRALSYAVEEGYQTLLQVGRHPVAVVNLQVPPSDVDVNVHPAKTEVRLLRERLIYGGLRDAVRAAVTQGSGWGQETAVAASITEAGTGGDDAAVAPRLIDASTGSALSRDEGLLAGGKRLPILRLMGQVAQTYIVAEGEKGLYLIDQHAAHERVLLDRLAKSRDREGNTQLLLEPVPLELAPGQQEMVAEMGTSLESLGYRLEPFGDGSVLVRGVPTELPPGEAVRALAESLQELAEEKPALDHRERLVVALSCRSAVKAGQILAPEEMRALVEALEESDITQHCSHGRPTAILLSHSQLEREFGRR